MKPLILLLGLSITFLVRSSKASNPGNPPAATARVSADDFDFRDMIPYLFAASALPEDEGVKTILENAKVLRSYVAKDVLAECKPGNDRCDSGREGFTPESEITRRIDAIVKEGIIHRHKTASLDYPFDGRPFPFSEISVLRSEKRQDAYLIIQFSDRAYNVVQVQAKYGAPYDTDIYDRYSVFKYRLENARYSSKAYFEVNPIDGSVMKLAISLKAKAAH
jgi:hypothetical protein